ncbi:hypothetical protein, partial [Yersinia pestis]|uniref:hypothetical protein n=1 Tax=Yersinia pestis TaxID=632 RepID=UPI000AFBBD77
CAAAAEPAEGKCDPSSDDIFAYALSGRARYGGIRPADRVNLGGAAASAINNLNTLCNGLHSIYTSKG